MKLEGSEMSYLVTDTFTNFTASDQGWDPIKWEYVVRSDDVDEYGILKTTKSTSKINSSKYNRSIFQNPTQMIKLSCCNQLIYISWKIFTSDDLNDIDEYGLTKITKSTSETNPSNSNSSRSLK